MDVKLRLSGFLILALTLFAAAAALEALALSPSLAERFGLVGFTPAPVLFFDGLLLITALGFVASLALPHQRVALVQAMAVLAYGVAMVAGGLVAAALALAKLAALLGMLLAFPFGTIAYFLRYACVEPSPSCFQASAVAALATLVLKASAAAALLVASLKFAMVAGLVTLIAISAGLSLGLAAAIWFVDGLPFLLHPLDAVLTAAIAVAALVYGVFTCVKALVALAAAIAGQAA